MNKVANAVLPDAVRFGVVPMLSDTVLSGAALSDAVLPNAVLSDIVAVLSNAVMSDTLLGGRGASVARVGGAQMGPMGAVCLWTAPPACSLVKSSVTNPDGSKAVAYEPGRSEPATETLCLCFEHFCLRTFHAVDEF